MARSGDTLHMGADRLTFLATAADTDGAYLEVEVDYASAAHMPPAHYHPKQTELFRVQSGQINVRLDGTLHTYSAGAEFHIPPGVAHSMWNDGPERARMTWRVTPAYRTEQLFETLWGLAGEGRLRPDGTPFLQMPLLALGFREEYRAVTGRPFAVDMALSTLLAPVGLACGYRPTYQPPQRADQSRSAA
jgi:quercetin dioxygenase-like cupin family protein